MSEDCLNLNVWTPSLTPSQPAPVMVFIHGGSFVSGSGSMPEFDGANLAARGVVTVTINYRLGALGWLVEPGLIAQAPSFFQNAGDAGNYGLMDQQFALQWVQRNICGFGGDARKVTVGGESAGGDHPGAGSGRDDRRARKSSLQQKIQSQILRGTSVKRISSPLVLS